MLLIGAILATLAAAVVVLLTIMGNANLPAPSVQSEGFPGVFWLTLVVAIGLWLGWVFG